MIDIASLARKQVKDLITHRYGVVYGYRTVSGVCILFGASTSMSSPCYMDILWFFAHGEKVIMVGMEDVSKCKYSYPLPQVMDNEGRPYWLERVDVNKGVLCGFDIAVSPVEIYVPSDDTPCLLP